jgi:hypothetical protein
MITQDRSTWPTGDKYWEVCQAIAIAEGYHKPNSNPWKLCNPGDISDGFGLYGGEPHFGSRITRFPSQEFGWKWLYNKIVRIDRNLSEVFHRTMTWEEIAKEYAGDWQHWLANVTCELGVDESAIFGDFFQ